MSKLSDHSFEEIRDAALDLLSGREKGPYPPTQFVHIEHGIADVFARRESAPANSGNVFGGSGASLSGHDQDVFLEVFWSLFQQGIIVLGCDRSNPNFPWCRLSSYGKKLTTGTGGYFFHDVSTYEHQVRQVIPAINAVTLVYLKEAIQAFRAGCLLSATIMIGVAAEHTFLLLLDCIEANPKHAPTFKSVSEQRSILPKVNKFKGVMDNQYVKQLPPDVKEDWDTNFVSLQSLMKNYRNDAGHPTGKMMDREQVYVLLHLFITYGKKMYQLMDYFR